MPSLIMFKFCCLFGNFPVIEPDALLISNRNFCSLNTKKLIKAITKNRLFQMRQMHVPEMRLKRRCKSANAKQFQRKWVYELKSDDWCCRIKLMRRKRETSSWYYKKELMLKKDLRFMRIWWCEKTFTNFQRWRIHCRFWKHRSLYWCSLH